MQTLSSIPQAGYLTQSEVSAHAGLAGKLVVARALPAAHELGEELLWGDVVVSEQNEAVIPEVAHLVEDLLAHVVLRGDDRLDSLLADLLEDFVLALVKQVVRETKNGRDMRREAGLLRDAVASIVDSKQESDVDSFFAGGTTATPFSSPPMSLRPLKQVYVPVWQATPV